MNLITIKYAKTIKKNFPNIKSLIYREKMKTKIFKH